MNPAAALIAALLVGPYPSPTPGPAAAPDPPPAVAADHAVRPLEPSEVVAGFDPPEEAWTAGHRGVDLLGTVGQPVRAALAGTVTFAGVVAGKGVVVVDHGGRRTTYEPVRALVSVGADVDTGEVIGMLAGDGHCAPSACLHWGLRVGDEYLDPLSLLGDRPVRLLPLLPDESQ